MLFLDHKDFEEVCILSRFCAEQMELGKFKRVDLKLKRAYSKPIVRYNGFQFAGQKVP